MTATIGVVRPGSTFEGMIERHGDYDAWFARALEPTGVRIVVHDAVRHAPPEPGAADGWIVTGARASVTALEPWSERLFEWLRAVVDEGAPVLGVCYGHQALCAALGGRVERHAEGWEIGTTEVELTDAGRQDPLFRGFPERFAVQTTHEDHVAVAPPGATLLATNPHTPVQAVAVGGSARGVQFHPEVTPEISREFVETRRHLLPADPRIEDAPLARAVLANFVDGFVGR
ncbi:MAG TPA: glutamine amidotransferase [Gemmatimonadota bacterium]|nr:glutamine amidotransferase [Gemmatimonadota bacterium]